MTNKQIIKIAKSCGLVCSGLDEEGQPIFVGTKEEWSKFEKMQLDMADKDEEMTYPDDELEKDNQLER